MTSSSLWWPIARISLTFSRHSSLSSVWRAPQKDIAYEFVKLGGFRSQLQASYVPIHTEELWYNETVYLWMTIYIYIYIYIFGHKLSASTVLLYPLCWRGWRLGPPPKKRKRERKRSRSGTKKLEALGSWHGLIWPCVYELCICVEVLCVCMYICVCVCVCVCVFNQERVYYFYARQYCKCLSVLGSSLGTGIV